MEFRIADGIRRHLKKSYAIESEDLFVDFDVDCGEGINTVMASERAREAFAGLNFAMAGPYPHSPALKDAVVAHAPRSSGQKGPERNNIVLCDGSVAGLYLVNRLFLEPGDRVLGYVPQFSEYETDVKMRGCLFDAVPLRAEDGYRFDPDAFIAALRPEHKLAYLDNPNNPTGQVIPLAAIEKILRAAAALNVAVLVDEAYGDYMAPECSALTLWGGHENLLGLRAGRTSGGLSGVAGRTGPRRGQHHKPLYRVRPVPACGRQGRDRRGLSDRVAGQDGGHQAGIAAALEAHRRGMHRTHGVHFSADPRRPRRGPGPRVRQTAGAGHIGLGFFRHRQKLGTLSRARRRGYGRCAGRHRGYRRPRMNDRNQDPWRRLSAPGVFEEAAGCR